MSSHVRSGERDLAAMLASGRNQHTGDHTEEDRHEPPSDAALVEATVDLGRPWGTSLGRLERVEKSGEALALEGKLAERPFVLHSLTLGHLQERSPIAGMHPGIGATVSDGRLPSDALAELYDTIWPVGFFAYSAASGRGRRRLRGASLNSRRASTPGVGGRRPTRAPRRRGRS